MLSKKSIRTSFLIKLVIALVALILSFSVVLYSYITYGVDRELKHSLMKQAEYLFATYPDVKVAIEKNGNILKKTLNINAKIVYLPKAQYRPTYMRKVKLNDREFVQILLPYDFLRQTYLSISADVTEQKKMQQKVYNAIVLINLLGMVIIIFYAYFLSGMLIAPIRILTDKLSKRNEHMMDHIKSEDLPLEFQPLADSINMLMSRIQNFVKYKKELFIGSAHELKTPLAVMKTKTQVTLLKRSITKEDLTDALKQNIISIDEMNKIVSSILEFGRAEGAQFETPKDIDVIDFLRAKANDYKILADSNNQKFSYDLTPKHFTIHIQPMLLTQILQNFVQNALKFTPNDKRVVLRSYLQDGHLVVEVIDEGIGIDDSRDLFAPFVRSQNSSGVGLGLFLVKSAADGMGAKVELINRSDKSGTIARLTLPKYPFCKI